MDRDTLFQRVKDAGCEYSNHESDLYVKATPLAGSIFHQAKKDGLVTCYYTFEGSDGNRWYEAPFMYDQFWEGLS